MFPDKFLSHDTRAVLIVLNFGHTFLAPFSCFLRLVNVRPSGVFLVRFLNNYIPTFSDGKLHRWICLKLQLEQFLLFNCVLK